MEQYNKQSKSILNPTCGSGTPPLSDVKKINKENIFMKKSINMNVSIMYFDIMFL